MSSARRTHRAAVAVVAAAIVLVALVGAAGPAAAHATLVSSTPATGEALAEAPSAIVLRFDEPVELSLGSVTVIDGNRRKVEASKPRHDEGGAVVRVDLPSLGAGAYVVSWRVVSSDSHPIAGAFTFTVGNVAADPSLLAAVGRGPAGDRVVGIAFGVARGVIYGALALVIGLGMALVTWWPDGTRSPLARGVLAAGWAAAFVWSLAGIGLQGAYARAGPLRDAFRPGVWADVIDTRFGRYWLARAVVLALIAPFAVVAVRRIERLGGTGGPAATRRSWWAPIPIAAALVAIGLSVTVAASGHAAAGTHPSIGAIAGTVHVLAMALWLGSIVAVVLLLVDGETTTRGAVLRRFSGLALGCVVALVASGLVQTWREVPSLHAFTDTTYGRLLLGKFGVVLVVLAAASLGRRLVHGSLLGRSGSGHRPRAESWAGPRSLALARTVRFEAMGAVGVLALTAVLVATVPARSAGNGPFEARKVVDDIALDVVVDPARAGFTEMHLYLSPLTQTTRQPDEVTATLTKPPELRGPLPVDLLRAGPTHYVSNALSLPFSGTWTLELAMRFGEFDLTRTTVELRIG
jgi:copper transport protein